MGYRHRHSKHFIVRHKNVIIGAAIVIMAIILASLLYINKKQEEARSEELAAINAANKEEQEAAEAAAMISLGISDDWTLSTEYGTVVISSEELSEIAEFRSGYNNDAYIQFDISDYGLDFTENYMFEFVIYTEEKAANIDIDTGTAVTEYYITTQASAFYLPIDGDTLQITLDGEFQNTYVYNAQIVKIDSEIVSGMDYGQYNLADIEEFYLSDSDMISDEVAINLTADEEYLYVLHKNELVIYDMADTSIQIGSVSGLGNTRDIAFVDENTLVITGRENGVFLIDISSPDQPYIISTYDALDLATGIAVSETGDYIFVCSRYFGVEIVDISDKSDPELVSVLNAGSENIQCCYSEGYLYISNWNAQTVYIYDVTNVNDPDEVGSISVDGNPYGIAVSDGNLFVATGHHSQAESSEVGDEGFGAGHGLEIYDVSDPENAEWLSTVKADGRLYYIGMDNWNVSVSGNYAYLSSTYSGIYVYDISDTSAPVRISTIERQLVASENGITIAEDTAYFFPYDPDEYVLECFNAIAIADGEIYLAGQFSGVYELDLDIAEAQKALGGGTSSIIVDNDGSYFEGLSIGSLFNFESEVYSGYGTVNAVELYDNGLVLACGENGIIITDSSGNVVRTIETAGSADDVLISGNTLYVAEGNYGMEAYDLVSYTLTASFESNLQYETITQLAISSDGNYLLAQDGWTRVRIFDISEGSITSLDYSSTGSLYFRNLINQNADCSVLGYASRTEFVLYDTESGIEEVISIDNTVYGESNGMCEYEGKIIAVYNNGYIIIDPDELNSETDLSSYELYSIGTDYRLKGKITCYDGIMVASDSYNRTVTIVDISDIENPVVLEQFSVDGNVDLAVITNDYIYIPLKYQGLMVIKR